MTIRDKVLVVFSDEQWHCCAHQQNVSSSHIASHVRDLRKKGYKFEEPTLNRFCEYRDCEICGRKTIHRKLISIPQTK